MLRPQKEHMSQIASDQSGSAQGLANQQDDHGRLITALQCAGDGIIVTDLDGKVEFLNVAAARLTGFENNTAMGRKLQEVLKLRESLNHPIRHDLVNLAIVSENPIALGKDVLLVAAGPRGETRQIEGEISARLGAGVPTGAVVTFRDVTARNREELQRREEQKLSAVSHLAGAVAHELNNLLTIVLGNCEALEDMYPDSAPLHASTAEIQRVTAGVSTMTRQLLTLSRREVLHPHFLKLNSLLEGLVPTFRKILPGNVDLRMALDPNIGTILADSTQMEQAITDLVQQCRNRLSQGGALAITTSKVVIESNVAAQHLRRYVQVAIEDSGPSLRGQSVEELFEPSWDSNPSRPQGIGLFTVRNMIAAANGHFSIESSSSIGAKFIMLFPESEAEILPDERKPVSTKLQENRTVMLVEDNDSIRILLRNAFEKRGYRVIEARDGEEAMLQSDLHTEVIDLLISDVVMPVMDGPTLASKLGAQRPMMKVILISGCPIDPAAVRELVSAGAQFVLKPFTQRDLLARVEDILT